MSAPTAGEILTKVGFEKSKMGSGDKEVGYQIKESSLSSLMGSACVCFLVMGFLVVSMVYDVHFEKKTIHRRLRVEEHHAASKLAQVQMELWSEFHHDIQESHEAQALLRSMNDTYTAFQGNLKTSVHELSAEIGLNPVKAEKFTDKLLHLVANMQQENVKHAKHLVDHLVAAGKRSVKLEKHVNKAVLEETKEEKKLMEQDVKDGINAAEPLDDKKPVGAGGSSKDAKGEEDENDPMKEMIAGFFLTYNDFLKEFGGEARSKMKKGNAVFDQIETLYEKTKSENNPLTEDEIQAEIEKIDLKSVGAALGAGRVLPVRDIVEEIALIPHVPYKLLTELEESWKTGKVESVVVIEKVEELLEKKKIPSGWMQGGVDNEEGEEQREEESEEAEEDIARQEGPGHKTQEDFEEDGDDRRE